MRLEAADGSAGGYGCHQFCLIGEAERMNHETGGKSSAAAKVRQEVAIHELNPCYCIVVMSHMSCI